MDTRRQDIIRLTYDHFQNTNHKCPKAHKWPVGCVINNHVLWFWANKIMLVSLLRHSPVRSWGVQWEHRAQRARWRWARWRGRWGGCASWTRTDAATVGKRWPCIGLHSVPQAWIPSPPGWSSAGTRLSVSSDSVILYICLATAAFLQRG